MTKSEGDSSVSGQNSGNKMTLLRAAEMPEFDPNSHHWNEWKERLEIHFAEIDCEDEKNQKSTLLKSICSESYSLLRALCDPIIPAKKTYAELCDLLDVHYSPPVIIYRERLNFYSATKKSDETVTAWYARVKTLALKCKFTHLDDSVRDRFVVGMASDEKIFDKLCEEDQNLTTNDALRKALIQETKIKAKADSNVNFIRKSAGTANSKVNGNRYNNSNKGSSDTKKKMCKHCGWKTHESASCKFKQSTCHACSRVGHLASICKSKEKKNINSINSIDSSSSHNTNFFSKFSNEGEDDNRFSIFNVTAGQASDSFGLSVEINGVPFESKCDTGAPCSLMSAGAFDKFFDRKLLKPSQQPYFDYGGNLIKIIGEFYATVKYRDHFESICFIVTDTKRPILLGETFLNKFSFKLIQINNISTTTHTHVISQIKSEFSEVFKRELGTYSGCKVKLTVVDGTKQYFSNRDQFHWHGKKKLRTN